MKDINQIIVEICKICECIVSLKIEGFSVNSEGKVFKGWWDEMCPRTIEEMFHYDEKLQWLKDNVAGAEYLYKLNTFWGCAHTTYYLFKYGDGNYKHTEHVYAIT